MISKIFPSKLSNKKGLPPGSLIFVGEPRNHPIEIEYIGYQSKEYEELKTSTFHEAWALIDQKKSDWININGVHKASIIEETGKYLGIHSLWQEDILNTSHPVKFEMDDDHLFIILKMLRIKDGIIDTEQVSFILHQNALVSFQEKPGDLFDTIRERIHKQQGRICQKQEDYLLIALIDVITDHYFEILNFTNHQLEKIEDEIMNASDNQFFSRSQEMKRDLAFVRNAIQPLSKIIRQIKEESDLINEENKPFFTDVIDHLNQLNMIMKNQFEMLGHQKDMYMSMVSFRMNQVMKVLTIIATIFIPLTFVARIYGMNFAHMPELNWHHGYPAALSLMAIIALAMLWFFRRKKWL